MVTQRQQDFLDDEVLREYLEEHDCYDKFCNNIYNLWGIDYPNGHRISALLTAFDWSQSSEGDAFWRKLNDGYEESYRSRTEIHQYVQLVSWLQQNGLYGRFLHNLTSSNPYPYLSDAFTWGGTPEGSAFWIEVNRRFGAHRAGTPHKASHNVPLLDIVANENWFLEEGT